MPSSLFPSFLKPLAAHALELALNRLLTLDPDTSQALRTLDGQCIALSLKTPAVELQIRVDGECLRVGPVDAAYEMDLKVHGRWPGFLGNYRGWSRCVGLVGHRLGVCVWRVMLNWHNVCNS